MSTDAAGNIRNVTRQNGRYAEQPKCCGCNKPAGSEPFCDNGTGDVICSRKACLKRLDLPLEARKAHYAKMIAAR